MKCRTTAAIVSAILGVTLSTGRASTSAVGPERIYWDRGGMPRCIDSTASPWDPTTPAPLLLTWNADDPYSRQVMGVQLDDALRNRIRRALGSRTTYDLTCANIENLSQLGSAILGGTLIPEGERDLLHYSFDRRMATALSEARNGANEYHPETDAKTWLRDHPISEFNIQLDRELAQRYGMGFTAEIYAAWIEANPENAEFRRAILTDIAARGRKADGFIHDLFGNRVIVYVKGLGHELPSSARFNVMTDQLKALGAPIVAVDTPSFAPIRDNATVIEGVLEEQLSRGKHVILISLSKGSTESLLAVSRLRSRLEGPSHPAGYGRLDAFISMSGIYAPSFLVNWADNFPQWLITRDDLRQEFVKAGLAAPAVGGIRDLDDVRFPPILAEIRRNGIPRNTVYVNLVGARGGNGLSTDPQVGPLQNGILRKLGFLMPTFGANDGYIEYPGTEMPRDLSAHRYVLAVNASHAIIDGDVDGMSMSEPRMVRNFAGALLLETIRRVEKISDR